MPRLRRDQTFRQTDLTRAVKAMRAAGVTARYEINAVRKTITIIPIPDDQPQDGGAGANPWDKVLTNAADEKRAS
jgi:hypothetical protein